MFGLTSQPTRSSSTTGRITQNKLETDFRKGANSSTYDNSAAERMKMDYLRQERDRRERERNKLVYDGKKRELDQLLSEIERYKSEQKRLEGELVKYTHDVEGMKQANTVAYAILPTLKKEQLELVQHIQKLESELLQAKNRQQKVVQDIAELERKNKSSQADIHKRESYEAGVKTKLEDVKKRLTDDQKKITQLQNEVADLKRKI